MTSPSNDVELDYQTLDYKLVISTSNFDTGCKGEPCYKLINRRNGVVEGESLSLPDSIGSMILRQKYLDEADEAYSQGSVVPPSFEPGPGVH